MPIISHLALLCKSKTFKAKISVNLKNSGRFNENIHLKSRFHHIHNKTRCLGVTDDSVNIIPIVSTNPIDDDLVSDIRHFLENDEFFLILSFS